MTGHVQPDVDFDDIIDVMVILEFTPSFY
jgi:hypothetical protein